MPRDFKMLVRLVLSGFFSLGLAAAAWAGEVQPYSADAFAAAQAGGAPIVLHVTADWCPTCHVQRPIVRSLAEARITGISSSLRSTSTATRGCSASSASDPKAL